MSLTHLIKYSVALGAGILGTLAFAPFNFWWLGLASIAIWMRLSIKHPSFFIGFIYGLGLFGSGVSWVAVSMTEHGGASIPLAFAMTSIFAAGLAIFPGLASWGYASWHQRWSTTLGRVCLLTACWVTMEAFRSWFLTGFPWLLFGYSALNTPFEGYLSWFGVFGVSAIIALSAGGFLASLTDRRLIALIIPSVFMVTGPILNGQFQPNEDPTQATRVALWQPVIAQSEKWKPEFRGRIVEQHVVNGLPADAGVIIWPETALPMTESRVNATLPDLDLMLLSNGQTLITGVLGQSQGRYTNRLITLGSGQGTYDKTRLVPFGEYVPLESLLRGLIAFFDLPMSAIIPGSQHSLLTHGYLKFGPLICYEIAYTSQARQIAADANVILTVSNDTWFGDSIGPAQHLQIAQIRARELGKPVVRATNDGLTAFINARGQVESTLPRFERGILSHPVIPATTVTPYSLAGETPLIILLIVILTLTRREEVFMPK
jgi:apolipoprotein N-acyltransferase